MCLPCSIQDKICYVVATDDGWRPNPVPMPVEGLLIGIAERYEIVCNFGHPLAAGRTLYLYNAENTVRAPDVPFFCLSHLLARLKVGPAMVGDTNFDTTTSFARPANIGYDMLSKGDMSAAMTMCQTGKVDRRIQLGRSNGKFVVNGLGWTGAPREVRKEEEWLVHE
jgi:hypothetical protein